MVGSTFAGTVFLFPCIGTIQLLLRSCDLADKIPDHRMPASKQEKIIRENHEVLAHPTSGHTRTTKLKLGHILFANKNAS